MNLVNDVKDVFEKKGVFVSLNTRDEELMLDSLQFVAIIVDLEKKFNIEIEDSYYAQNVLQSFNDFVKLVSDLTRTPGVDK